MSYLRLVLMCNLVRRNKISPFCKISGDPRIEKGATLRRGARVDATNGPLRIAEGVWIDDFVRITSVGTVSVGRNTTINRNATITGDISIGHGCLIGPNVFISSGHHEFRSRSMSIRGQDEEGVGQDRSSHAITIGDDVWLGVNSVVLPGVRLGRGVVVGANAVVTKSFPDYQVVAGVPARVVGERS